LNKSLYKHNMFINILQEIILKKSTKNIKNHYSMLSSQVMLYFFTINLLELIIIKAIININMILQ